jgi:hypothetical protein
LPVVLGGGFVAELAALETCVEDADLRGVADAAWNH